MSTVQLFKHCTKSLCLTLFLRKHCTKSLPCSYIKHNIRKLSSQSTSSPISNQVLWGSISQDSAKKISDMTFSDVYQRTKAFADDDIAEFEDLENVLVYGAEVSRKQASLRIAKLITSLNNMPFGLSTTSSISTLMNMYVECYEELKEFRKIQVATDCDEYYKLRIHFLVSNLLAIPKICHGLLQKSTEKNSIFNIVECGDHLRLFIDEFASQRLALSVMAVHNITLYKQIINNDKIKMGLFKDNCNVLKYIQSAIIDSLQECERHFFEDSFGSITSDNIMPKVNIYDKRNNKNGIDVSYIPQHLHQMIFELLKNSMRAVVETDSKNDKEKEIDIIIVDSKKEDNSITIKISDIGGGISRINRKSIWLYGYTTAHQHLSKEEKMRKYTEIYGEIIDSAQEQWGYNYGDHHHHINDNNDNKKSSNMDIASILGAVTYTPMFGLGYGLPITKLYAEYFGGQCVIQSVDGYGTDAYLFLTNLRNNQSIIN